MTRPKPVVLSSSDHCGARLSSRVKGGVVSEHAMHDHSELAGERDLGFGHAGAPRDAHAPALKLRTALDWLRQHNVSGLVEGLAHRGVADLANATGAVGLAGLMLLRGEPKVGSDLFGRPKPCRIVN